MQETTSAASRGLYNTPTSQVLVIFSHKAESDSLSSSIPESYRFSLALFRGITSMLKKRLSATSTMPVFLFFCLETMCRTLRATAAQFYVSSTHHLPASLFLLNKNSNPAQPQGFSYKPNGGLDANRSLNGLRCDDQFSRNLGVVSCAMIRRGRLAPQVSQKTLLVASPSLEPDEKCNHDISKYLLLTHTIRTS